MWNTICHRCFSSRRPMCCIRFPPRCKTAWKLSWPHGYTELEKVEIAKQFLVRKQREATGMILTQLTFGDDALREIIR